MIGAGIVGVTTAYELARDDHEVVVYERHGAVAAETSFANAGVLAPGYVTPWAAPGMPTKVARYLFSQHAPVKLALPLAGADLAGANLRGSRLQQACLDGTVLRDADVHDVHARGLDLVEDGPFGRALHSTGAARRAILGWQPPATLDAAQRGA